MIDLKASFDAVNAAQAHLQQKASQINDMLGQGTDEASAQALEMRPELDAAQAAYDQALDMYQALQMVNRPNDIARNFVPVTTDGSPGGEGEQPTTIKRDAYNKLNLVDRAKFVQSGGKIED